MSTRSPLREPELVQMLADEPELLALADAVVETDRERPVHSVKGRRRRRLVVAAVVVAALAVASVAIADRSLFGFSNHGKRAYPGSFALHELHWNAGLWKKAGLPVPDTARPGTFARMALRQGIGVYIARSKKDNTLCFYTGQRQSLAGEPPNRLYLSGPGCELAGASFALPYRLTHETGRQAEAKQRAWLRNHPFPSPARPVVDMSSIPGVQTRPKGYPRTPSPQRWTSVGPLVGVAVNRVRSVQLLAQSDCHAVVTVPVINNVYIDAHPPAVAYAFIVARDANRKVVWHSWPLNDNVRTPIDRKVPRNCGLR